MLDSGQLRYDFDDIWVKSLETSVPKESKLGKTRDGIVFKDGIASKDDPLR